MIPSIGWLSAQEFWDIYTTQPQVLPGDIDFAELHKFEALTAEERELAELKANPPPPELAEVDDPRVVDDPLTVTEPTITQ